MPTLGLIIPVFNEQEIIAQVVQRVQHVLDQLDLPAVACFVDDGSRDETRAHLQAASAADPRLQYLSFSRNFGHQTAVLAGLRELDADVYVIIDGDLQDPPELIPQLLDEWRQGNQVVYCVRHKRKEVFLKRWAYAAFYRLLRSVSYLNIPLDTGDFCLMDRAVVDQLRRMPEQNQFIRGLRTWVGFRQTAFHYERDARAGGEPKYNLRKLMRLATDGLLAFSDFPLAIITRLGVVTTALAALGVLFVLLGAIWHQAPPTALSLLAAGLFFLGGVQLTCLGIVATYIGRIYDDVRGRPLYVVHERSSGLARSDEAAGHNADPRSRFAPSEPVVQFMSPPPAQQSADTPESAPANAASTATAGDGQ